MRNSIKAVSILLVTAMMSVLFTACSLFGGKTRNAVIEVASAYADAVMAYDVETQTKYMEPGHNAVSSIEMPSFQRDLYAAVMASSVYEIRNVEGKEKTATASCDVVFAIPDLDVITGTEEAAGYSKDELVAAIASSTARKEVTLSLNFVFEFDSWLISAASTTNTADFILSIGEGIEVKAISDTEAMAITEEFIGYLIDKDVEEASSIYFIPDGSIFDEDMRATLPDGLTDSIFGLYSEVFSDFDYEAEVHALGEDSVVVSLSGTAPDLASASDNLAADTDAMVSIYSSIIMAALEETTFDPTILYDELLSHIDGSGDFNVSFIVSSEEDGQKKIAFDNQSEGALLLNSPDRIIYDTDGSEFIRLAADLLLEEGTITQEQYSDITDIFSIASEDGITVTYEGSDELYDFAFERNEEGILIRVGTWGFYEEATGFNYDITRQIEGQEPVVTNGVAGIAADSVDNMYFTVEISEEEFAMGGIYTVNVYELDGTTILVTAVFELPRTAEEEEPAEEEGEEGSEESSESSEELTEDISEETSEDTTEETTEESAAESTDEQESSEST